MHAFGRPVEGRFCVCGSWPCSAVGIMPSCWSTFFIFFGKRMYYNGSWIPFPHVLSYRDFYLFVRWEVSATTVEIRCVCVCRCVADNWYSRCHPGHRTVSGCEPGTRWAWESPANTRAPCAAPLSPGPTGTLTTCAPLGKRLVTSSSSGRWVL